MTPNQNTAAGPSGFWTLWRHHLVLFSLAHESPQSFSFFFLILVRSFWFWIQNVFRRHFSSGLPCCIVGTVVSHQVSTTVALSSVMPSVTRVTNTQVSGRNKKKIIIIIKEMTSAVMSQCSTWRSEFSNNKNKLGELVLWRLYRLLERLNMNMSNKYGRREVTWRGGGGRGRFINAILSWFYCSVQQWWVILILIRFLRENYERKSLI